MVVAYFLGHPEVVLSLCLFSTEITNSIVSPSIWRV